MATLITKNSSTASSVPTNAQLVQGELAVNVTDKRLYTENASGTVVELGTNPGSAVTHTAGTAGAPAITTTGDTNTGLFFPAADTVAASVGGTEGLRLTSTGLGVGTSSPAAKLNVDSGSAGLMAVFDSTNANGGYFFGRSSGTAVWDLGTAKQTVNVGGATDFGINVRSGFLSLGTGNTERLRLDSSGNLGLGVTPSAWTTATVTPLQVKNASFSGTSTQAFVGNNWYYGGGDKYISSAAAAIFQINGSTFSWQQAPSGTAGNAISFTQAMTLDASGNLGVGSTSPNILSLNRALTLNSTGNQQGIEFAVSGAVKGLIQSNGDTEFIMGSFAAIPLTFRTGNTERARITSGGSLSIGLTTSSARLHVQESDNRPTAQFSNTNSSFTGDGVFVYNTRNTTNSTYNHIACSNGDFSGVFLVKDSGNVQNTNNSYGSTSDIKLKENIVDATPKLEKLNQVRVVNYNLKSQPDQKLLGVIAQELEQIFPGMVEESTDRDKDGNDLGTTTKSVKYSVFVPMLIKAMQEQQAMIQQLQAEVAALKGT